jgi:peptidoglycan/xylan/chitin deacetylase (PgdA/CDA1 family)
LERLKAKGMKTVTVSQAAALLEQGEPLPEHAIAITFDDGYLSVYKEALPALAKSGFTATVYVVSGSGDLPSSAGRPRMAWNQIKELQRAGIEIGAHTISHPDLRRLAERDVEREVAGSRAAIEDAIGAPVKSFAYPFGYYNEQVRNVVKGYFANACSVDLGLAKPGSDVHALERVETHYLRNPRTFDLVGSPLLGGYLGIRNVPRLVRRAFTSGAPR